ncbi:PIN domain-containing protein [Methanolobus sp. WCC1]|uniref:PIN domain-containing protein n=1 Tax=unclassified Methanolobus TaxID=2629569 RepID=UPI0032564310
MKGNSAYTNKQDPPVETNECFYLFLDTNLFYSKKITYSIFNIRLLNDLLSIRDNFNNIFGGYRKIEILIPKLVLDEIYAIKTHLIQSEISKFQRTIEHLDERKLSGLLEYTYEHIHSKLESKGSYFLSWRKIVVVPYCNNNYLPTIIEKSVHKHLPFKPFFDQKKNRYVGDNGFKDTVIWYSIIDYVKNECTNNTNHVFFLTNNEKDFKSESTLLEFKEYTGNDIEIIDFKSTNPNVNNTEFKSFLNLILDKSNIPIPVKLESVIVSHTIIDNVVTITSIIVEPLSVNLKSMVYIEEEFPYLDDGNITFLNELITKILLKFRFDVSDLTFVYQHSELDSVHFDLSQYMFHVEISGITLYYNDGFEMTWYCSITVYESQEQYYDPSEFKDNYEWFLSEAFDSVYKFLIDSGIENVTMDMIDYEYFQDADI